VKSTAADDAGEGLDASIDPDRPAGASEAGDGVAATASRVAGSLAGLISARLELASLEWTEERDRLQLQWVLLLAGALLLALAVLTLGALVIIVFWDTHRIVATLAVALLYSASGALLLLRARQIGRQAGPPFAATRIEFAKDRAAWFAPGSHASDHDEAAP
jgi:uncharacterized membrane protein YqjE